MQLRKFIAVIVTGVLAAACSSNAPDDAPAIVPGMVHIHGLGLNPPDEALYVATHYGLYTVILVMVSSGIATVILSGGGAQLAGAAPLPLPDFTLAPPFTVHGMLARVLIVLLIGHIGAALWHQFVRRDRLLARMGLGS